MRKQIKLEQSQCARSIADRSEDQSDGFLILRGKWRPQILAALQDGPVRLSLLQKCLEGVSKKVLHENLRALEVAGVVERHDLTGRIPYIEYRLTHPTGVKLANIAVTLQNWKPSRLHSDIKN